MHEPLFNISIEYNNKFSNNSQTNSATCGIKKHPKNYDICLERLRKLEI